LGLQREDRRRGALLLLSFLLLNRGDLGGSRSLRPAGACAGNRHRSPPRGGPRLHRSRRPALRAPPNAPPESPHGCRGAIPSACAPSRVSRVAGSLARSAPRVNVKTGAPASAMTAASKVAETTRSTAGRMSPLIAVQKSALWEPSNRGTLIVGSGRITS